MLNGLERLTLMRLLQEKISELSRTRGDLDVLRKALVRTFA